MQTSASARIRHYLELLYDPRSEERVCRLERHDGDLITTVDPERLRIERSARHRNLRHGLRRTLDLLMSNLDEELQLEIVERLCASEDFWKPSARTLGEAYCLVAWRVLTEAGKPVLAELARFNGVCDGICGGDRATPWPRLDLLHRLVVDKEHRSETFVSPCPLVLDGRVPALNELREHYERGIRWKATVVRTPDYVATNVEQFDV